MPAAPHILRRRIERSSLATAALHVALAAIALLFLSPLLWLLCASFKRPEDVFRYAFVPWRHLDRLTLDNFRTLFSGRPFARWMFNSLLVSCAQTSAVVTFSSLGGFALAKYSFRGKRLLMLMMLSTMLLPGVVLLSGSLQLMTLLGWINSFRAVILPGAVSAFGMFLYRQAMLAVPDELLAAGRVDGCSEAGLWWNVALPIVRPTTGAFTLLSFLASWNSYLWPSTVLADQSMFTAPLGLASMIGSPEFESQYGVLMAAALVGMLPVALLFFSLQNDFIEGLTSGAVKG